MTGHLLGSDVSVVAVHGTGTPLGDPIEVGALGHGFGVPGGPSRLTLASNKSCFGHTEGAAGTTPTLCCIQAGHIAEVPTAGLWRV